MKIKILLLSVIVLLLSITDTFAIGTKAKQFNQQVKIAGYYIKRGDFMGCREKLNRAQGIYDKLDAEDKANKLVVKSKKLFDQMSSKLDAKGFPAKQVSKSAKTNLKRSKSGVTKKKITKGKSFKSKGVSSTGNAVPRKVKISIDRYDKYIKNIIRCYNEKWISTAVRDIKRAEKEYAKIPSAYHNVGSLAENKKKFDDYSVKINKISDANKKARAEYDKNMNERFSFDSDVSKLENFLGFLNSGKKNKNDISLGSLGYLKGFDANSKQADEFLKKYKTRLESGKASKRTPFSSAEIIDLINNKIKYRNTIINNAISRELESVTNTQMNIVEDLTKNRRCSNYVMKKLKVADYKTGYEKVNEVTKYCKSFNIPLPKKRFDVIDSYKPKIQSLIKSAAAKGVFNKSKYPTTDSYMKKAAIKSGNLTNLDLVYVGMKKGASWKIHKNALGIPLYKTAPGMALYHKKGDNFYRGRPAVIKRVYNGNGYEPVSAVTLKPKFYVYKK